VPIYIYQYLYEPYVVVKIGPDMVLYDERFKGYGNDKVQHVYQLQVVRRRTCVCRCVCDVCDVCDVVVRQ